MKQAIMNDERSIEGAIETVLASLNTHRLRATYQAVGEVVGIPTKSVPAFLGKSRPYASWVVSRGTKSPAGYSIDDYHPDLFTNSRIIESAAELNALLA